ncbi:peptide-methionine (R)-S-oxide reductase MsrB [Litorisediminicola beolgyonensis]|uniref:peptide-methionine (R)-S-oxide reductase n=1 Tax=Litorisediminicola beolgyonensis TaxID=1173614 RepID=A0ABW3ZH76_9RHOB
MNRRHFMTTTAAALGLGPTLARAAEGEFEVTRTDAEWKAMLTDLEYKVMREEGTERAFTSPLNDIKEPGTFLCKGCDLPLYATAQKFDSGTGWPSFWAPVDEANVETKTDRSFFMTRTEVHCRRCGSHLGHIFEDGPPPTGLRHCINGVSLTFTPASA